MKQSMIIAIGVALVGLGSAVAVWRLTTTEPAAESAPLILYCAAGIKPPVEAAVRDFEKDCGTAVQIQYGGSGTLLSNLRIAGSGDLFLAADESYIRLARQQGLLAEAIPLARLRPVIAVPKGNPKNIRTLDDLRRADIRVALANPDAASIGRTLKELLAKHNAWSDLERHTRDHGVFKPTVGDVANDVRIGSVDAGIVWDATVRQYPQLDMVRLPLLDTAVETVTIGVLRSSSQPREALRLARYLGASDRGLKHFASMGYAPVDGDPWAESPEIVLYSGAVNRVAVEDTLRQFEEREGARITRVYNGCGILVGQMKAGGRPDAYLTCDRSFVSPVADLFHGEAVSMSETEIVILVPRGNPHGIRSLADLGKAGLRVGVTNPQQSTLGALTEKLLKDQGIYEPVMANVRTQTPTADMLVNQLRTGALDAVVVYTANTTKVRDQCELVHLGKPGPVAEQTFSIGKDCKYPQLVGRLFAALRSAPSRERYESAGFRWREPDERMRHPDPSSHPERSEGSQP